MMNPFDIISKHNHYLTQEEIDELFNNASNTTPLELDLQKHQWVDTGVPGGSCWCKHCDVDFGKENSKFCEPKTSVHNFDNFEFIGMDFEEEII